MSLMQKLQISIPEPCHENWQHMTPSDQGRFCNACAKTVVDFSMMSDYEVLRYFSTVSDEKVCGRALPNQLNREMTMPREPKKRLFWYWNYVAMFFMLFSKSNNAKAQGTVPVKTELQPTCNKVTMGMVAPQLNAERLISGKVITNEGTAVPNAAVRIRGSQTGTMTDAKGEYQIRVKNGDVLEFSSIGYEIMRKTVDDKTTILNATVTVLNPMMMGVLIVVRRKNDSDDYTGVNTQPNQVFEIKVKDKETLAPVNNATLIINGSKATEAQTKLTDRYGSYKLKKVKAGDFYLVTVDVNGYEKNEITVRGLRTDPRKVIKEVYLVKKAEIKKPPMVMGAIVSGLQIDPAKKPDTATKVVIGAVRSTSSSVTLLVVDGVPMPINYISTINPKDILRVDVLKGAAASALYGGDAGNGIIMVTTKKKNQSDSLSIAKAVIKKVANTIGLSSKPNTISLYPNPVRSGRAFVVSMDLQQAVEMQMQITDINGRIVFQKQITTTSKDHLEKIETDGRWPAGIYFLNVFNSNGGQQGKPISAVSFVVQ